MKSSNNRKGKSSSALEKNELTLAVLNDLLIREDFRASLKDLILRREEIESNPDTISIEVDEKNRVLSGELDVLVLLGMENEEFQVNLRKSNERRKRGNSTIREKPTLSIASSPRRKKKEL